MNENGESVETKVIKLNNRMVPVQPFIGKTYPVVQNIIQKGIDSLNGSYGNAIFVIEVSGITPDRFYPTAAEEIRRGMRACELTCAFSEMSINGLHKDIDREARKYLNDYEQGKIYGVIDLAKIIDSNGDTKKNIHEYMESEFANLWVHPLDEKFDNGKKRVLILDIGNVRKDQLESCTIDALQQGLLVTGWYFDEVRIKGSNRALDYEPERNKTSLRDVLRRYS